MCVAPFHLQCPHYYNFFAELLRNIPRSPDPFFVCHIPYHIGNGNTVQRPTTAPGPCLGCGQLSGPSTCITLTITILLHGYCAIYDPPLKPPSCMPYTIHVLGEWVNPHRERQTIPHGQTSSPPKVFLTPAAKARPDQAIATSAEAPGATHRAWLRSP